MKFDFNWLNVVHEKNFGCIFEKYINN
ncbi:YvbH-like oligomerization domain-containing protein [Bacillus andreraoultii]